MPAAVCVWPTTLGTVTLHGPLETTSATALPNCACVPAAGVWLITNPAATVLLHCWVAVPVTRPAPVSAVPAAVCVWPTTLGTVTLHGPVETTKATALPDCTWASAAGFWLITSPAATVLLHACVTAPTERFALASRIPAASCVSPTTLGTVTLHGPLETTSATELPNCAWAPADGV